MIFTKKEILPIFVIIIMSIFAVSLYMAPCIAKTLTHLFLPILTIATYLLMLFLPKLRQYYFIRLMLVLFMAGMFFFIFLSTMGLNIIGLF